MVLDSPKVPRKKYRPIGDSMKAAEHATVIESNVVSPRNDNVRSPMDHQANNLVQRPKSITPTNVGQPQRSPKVVVCLCFFCQIM